MIPRLVLIVILAVFALPGCVTLPDPEGSQERTNEIVARLDSSDDSLTQTFVSRRPRFNGISLWIGSGSQEGDPARSTIYVSLYREEDTETPLYTTALVVQGSGQHSVRFPPAEDPAGQRYIVEIKPGSGPLEVRGTNTDVFPAGQAAVNGVPEEADIAFRLTYEYNYRSALADAWRMVEGLWLAFPFFALLAAPGFLLLDFSGLRSRFDQGEQFGLSVGLSAALIPILMLWTSTFNISWSSAFVRLLFGGLGLFALWRLFAPLLRGKRFGVQPAFFWLLVVCLFALGLRLAMVRDLSAPAWVDSVHHALLTRLIVETGGFPDTLQPYFDLPPTEYHAGYHAGLAGFLWFTGLPLPEGMLIYGQVLNVLAVAVVYLLTTTLTKDRTAGVVSAAVAGLITPMPAYYTSWGRYSQLAGLLLLPTALALVARFMEEKRQFPHPARRQPDLRLDLRARLYDRQIPGLSNCRRAPMSRKAVARLYYRKSMKHPSKPVPSRRWFLPTTIVFAGLLLVHYRVVVFVGVLLLAYLASQVRFRRAAILGLARQFAGSIILPALAAVLLTLPWSLPNLINLLLPGLASTPGTPVKFFADFSWSYLTPALGLYSLYAAGLGLAAAVWKGRRFTVTLVLWTAGMFLFANLGALGLPLSNLVNNTSVQITLFMPIALLTGYLAAETARLALRFVPSVLLRPVSAVLVLGAAGLSFYGASKILPILNYGTLLFRTGDRPALVWIEANIPQDQTILIDPFLWGYGIYAGNDGGFWIEPLTGRQSFPPPVLFGFGKPETVSRIVDLSRKAYDSAPDPEALYQFMQEAEIGYIYSGVRGGRISPAALLESDRFDLLYGEQGAYVFKLNP